MCACYFLEDTSTGPVTNRHDNEGDELSKLQEKLSMKDKQLAETGILLKKLKKREEQLLEKYDLIDVRNTSSLRKRIVQIDLTLIIRDILHKA